MAVKENSGEAPGVIYTVIEMEETASAACVPPSEATPASGVWAATVAALPVAADVAPCSIGSSFATHLAQPIAETGAETGALIS